MIPYLEIPTIPLWGRLEIHAFGVLVAIGILVGANRTRFRARQFGLSDEDTASVTTWVVLGGFLFAHVFDVLAYQTDELARLPLTKALLLIVNPTAGLSSFGGFIGALLALLYWTRKHKAPLLAYADSFLYGLAFGWFFGRMGCYTAHDHPGAFTTSFIGVPYPEGVRHDLGFEEAMFALVLALTFWWLGRRPRKTGLYAAIACSFYGPVRFILDFLRVHDLPGADPRYFGLTPAQYGAIAVTLTGLVIAARVWRSKEVPQIPAKPLTAADLAAPKREGKQRKKR